MSCGREGFQLLVRVRLWKEKRINGYCWTGREQRGAFSSKWWGTTQTEEIQACWHAGFTSELGLMVAVSLAIIKYRKSKM